MHQPVLVIDSCSDLTATIVEDLGLEELHFPFVLAGQERADDFGRTLPHGALFAAMRQGDHPTTAQIPLGEMEALFRRHAEAGRTVVYLGFSSGLSGTFESAHLARSAVLVDVPDADIRLVDTLSASIIEGLIAHVAARMLAAGATADELVMWSERERLRA
ncbi:MAG TPA: DegV family protein, partial [Coriobacteriia bacterium]|nr:DegV family protein [Coriobacteriia bacterium]